MIPGEKVVLGMSGGVDSSVAGLLLKQAGYEVYGVLLRTWRADQQADILNAAENEMIESAQKSAETIGIPLQIVDTREMFRRIVIGYFNEAYTHGLTPNPCMICNRDVKWAALMEIADQMDAPWVSTGHYARILREGERVKLLKGRDPRKDQTYFLSHLSQGTLQRTIFPLGEYTKEQIRTIAREHQIEAVQKPESQDLCFLEGTDYRSFMLIHQPGAFSAGEIVDVSGNLIGTHNGLANYTIGQRKGLGVFRERPLYVIRKETLSNRLVAGYEEELGAEKFYVQAVNWIDQAPNGPFHAQLKIRYQARLTDAEVNPSQGNRFLVIPAMPLRDVTPGQFAVFYDGEVVLGGGTISNDL